MRSTQWVCLLLAVGAGLARAQAPVIGDLNFYGLRKVTPETILSAAQLKTGDRLPKSKGELEDIISQIPDVVLARVEAVCCDGSRATLFIGVEEKDEPHPSFRSEPTGEDALPPKLLDSYREFLSAVQRAAGRGDTSEDFSAGHSWMSDERVRAFQRQFVASAESQLALLRQVLHNAADPEQRAAAVGLIGYAPAKHDIIDDLQYALQDPDESVRANAARSLTAIGVLAAKQPALHLRISPTGLLDMLDSAVLSDRVEAVKALLTLTDGRDQSVLDLLREHALPPLAEMARWKTPRYALPPFLLLGRAAGLEDSQTQESWQKDDRESVIRKALGTGGK